MKLLQRTFSILLITGMLVSFFQPGVARATKQEPVPVNAANNKIEALLLDQFTTDGTADFIVEFAQADLSPAYQMNWEERGWFVYNTLTETAEKSQANAIAELDKAGLRYQTFIAGNELYVWGGNLTAAQKLAELSEVKFISATRTYYIDPAAEAANPALASTWAGELLANEASFDLSPQAITDWGITDTKADQFWSTFGSQGEGIVVANIDTGVQWNHPALDQSFKCGTNPSDPACWFDPSNICGPTGMCDNNGHGTHTMGTMVADDDPSLTYIAGMAPNAQWIACKGCETSSCSSSALLACADWILAPGGDPANRPNIVNNSWGGAGGNAWYQTKVQTWQADGIFPAFSAGNSTGCSSLGSPGDYQESFGTTGHMTNRAHIYAQGPSATFGHDPYTKPNISAPADGICSSVPGNGWDCGYSGTSMASPHSAGAVALLWSCNPSLVGQVYPTFEALQNTADDPTPPNPSCGVPPDGEGTNEDGYGYLNVLSMGLQYCMAEWGEINGRVTDAVTTFPIESAVVTGFRDAGGSWSDDTDVTGFYSMTVGTGTFTVTVDHPLYASAVITEVQVISSTPTVLDFLLEPRGQLFGYVTDATSGVPLAATVSVPGGPSTSTNPADGYYELYLDAGTYDVTASAPDYADETATVALAVGGQVQEDFTLLAAVAVAPDPIEITLEMGQTGTVASLMTNNMAVPYPFEFIEIADAGGLLASGGPDPFGYTFADSNEAAGPRYEWIDATDGTALNLTDDSEGNVSLPFAFDFYGTSATAIRVGNNGGFIFNATSGDLSNVNTALGSTTATNLVVPFWDDVDADTGNVYYKTLGAAPNRTFVIEWFNRPHYSNVGSATFELILYEGTNNIKFQYQDVVFGDAAYDYGASATVGIRQAGTNYLQYSHNLTALADGLAICFNYPDSPPCDGAPADWFGTSIVSGEVPAESSLGWTNAFSATTGAGIGQPGVYTARLLIVPTAPGLPSKMVGVSMTVTPSTAFGQIEGTVTSDRPGGPLAADILIEASDEMTVTLPTDPLTGGYSYWLEVGTYTVTASAPGYVAEEAVVTIVQGVTTQDFELALDAPEIIVTPPTLTKTLQFGQTGVETMVITNDGLQPLEFEIVEIPGGVGALGGGPDPFGYTWKDSNEAGGATFEWIDATDGTPLGLSDDGEANVTLPFVFDFYGTSSSAIRVGNNGGFFFNATTGDLSTLNADLGTTTTNNLVVPFWDDIDSDTGNVYYKTLGVAPHRTFVVEWFNRPHFSNVGSATFELILYEGTNNIKYQYLDVNFGNALYDWGVSATAGIRQTGTNFLQYSYNQAVIQDNMAICFNYPGSAPCDGGDVPWLSEDVTSGVILPGETQDVVVTFDASVVPEPGTYLATLMILNNDPLNGTYGEPVTMNVLPTGDTGLLEGTVTSDRPGGPLEANVLIEATGGMTWTVPTNPAGYYYKWLLAGPYTVTASADGYFPQTTEVTVQGLLTTTQNFELVLIAPEIVVEPASLQQTLDLGQTADQTLSISNVGQAPLTFELRERPVNNLALANTILLMGDDLSAAEWDTYRLALAGAGYSWDEWDLLTQPFPTLTELAAYETLIWTDEGVIDPGDADCQVVADWLVSGNKSLLAIGRDFIWDMANGTPGGGEHNLYLLLNTSYIADYAGTSITTLDGVAGDPIGGDFTPPNGLALAGTLDSNGDYASSSSVATTGLIYGPGGAGSGNSGLTHFESADYKTVWLGVNFHNGLTVPAQRDLLMSNMMGMLAGGDVPWLVEEPITGTLGIGETAEITVTFDAGVVADPGTYQAELRVMSNDPFNSSVDVPVTMNVLPTPDLGKLEGIITGLGYCNEESYPLEADVLIEASDGSSWSVVSDPTGFYYRWLYSGTYTVTASAPEYLDASAVVQITGLVTTTQDLALPYIESCLSWTPPSFSVTLPVDTQLTEPLTITNSGKGELVWELHETTRTVGLETFSIPRFTGTLPDDKTPISFGRAPSASPSSPVSGVPVLNPGAPGFVMNLSNDSLYRIPDLDFSSTWNLVGAPGVTSAYAGDFGPDTETLYLISDDTLSLYAVDPTTGSATLIGPSLPISGQTWTGMAWDPTTQTMYASATSGTTATLFTLNLATGQTTQVATISGAPYTIDIAVDGSGQMYSVDIQQDALFLIDKDTGIATYVGSIGFTANYAQGLDYDLDNDILYMAAYNFNGVSGQGELRIVDTTTGNTMLLGTFPGGVEVDALAVEAGGVPPWNEVPWVTEVPTNGIVGPESAFDVEVTFDTTGLTAGVCYTASLGLVHDDPGWETPSYIPLQLCVTPPPVYGVLLSPDQALQAPAGELVTYTLTVTNTGDASDSFDLSLGASAFPSSLSTNTVGPLAAGDVTTFEVYVQIPMGAARGEQDSLTVTAVSQGDPAKTDTATLTTEVIGFGVDLEPEASSGSGLPGGEVVYTLRMTNTGDVNDTFQLSFSNVEPGWVVTLPAHSFDLAPGAGVDVVVRVTIPAGAVGGAFDTFTLTATSTNDPGVFDEVEITTTTQTVIVRFWLPLVMKK